MTRPRLKPHIGGRLASGAAVLALAIVPANAAATSLAGPGPGTSDNGASWVSAPAMAPPAPTGATTSPYPAALGYVGDIEFWSPNRGLLITAGNDLVPAGLYAYNGVQWHQLSTVCGGTDGRIAWAGPDEFWTISDQRPGQVLPSNGTRALDDVSLCHFLNGQVVGSYAMPLDEPGSYEQMNAAACTSASNCWFGGALDSGGAFHLHWDGSSLTQVNASQDHETASMTDYEGQIYESVQLGSTDTYAAGESTTNPPLFHLIQPASTNPFLSLEPIDNQDEDICGDFCGTLPYYGTGTNGQAVDPTTLGGFALSSDYRAGAGDAALWAAAAVNTEVNPTGATAQATVLFLQDGNWTQVVPSYAQFPTGANGSTDAPLSDESITPVPERIAAEPNAGAAWIAVQDSPDDNQAHVDRLAITGSGTAAFTDQDVLGDAEGVGPRGDVSAITCPALADCWVATTTGWLFHLTNGTQLSEDTDSSFSGVISYRPPDSGVPAVAPATEPATNQQTSTATSGDDTTTTPTVTTTTVTKPPLVDRFGKPKLVHKTTLVLSFTVTATARVQIIAKRHGKIVARSKIKLFKPGRHSLSLKLNVHKWPTSLAVKATAVAAKKS